MREPDALRSIVLALLVLLLGNGCSPGAKVPPLPVLDTASLSPAVRAAIDQAAVAAQKESNNAETVTRLGMVLQAHGQNAAAEACYQRSHALDPSRYDTLYYMAQLQEAKGDHKAAVKHLREALRLRPSSRPARLTLARELREAGDPQAAAMLALDLTKEDPGDATAHYLLGRARNNEADLRRALELFPRYGAARFALSNLYRQEGKQEEAAAVLRDYERDKLVVPPYEDPETATLSSLAVSPAALLRRSLQEEAAGRLTEAAALQQQAIAMQPDTPDAWINLISLYARLGRDSEVEAAYAKAVQLAPGRAEAYYNYGVYCLQRNRFPAAKAAFEKTLSIAPRHAEACLNLGGILANEGRLEEAAAMLRRALAAKPEFEQARVELQRIEDYLRGRRR